MKRTLFYAAIILAAAVALNGCGYNKMQSQEEQVFAAWSNLESNLQRRADLIPNLVNTVKAYAEHEESTITEVIEARAKATSINISRDDLDNGELMGKFQQARKELSSAMSRLMVVVERYPDLKADSHFTDLMHQLEGTENRINVARQRYNEAARKFNYLIRKFPNNITNRLLLKLEPKEYFKAEPEAKQAQKVEF
ncbi:MAG: LemA family protein [Desulfosalsimonas sp.]